MIYQFWLFTGQCKSTADERILLYILEEKWQFAWVLSLISANC